MGLIRNLVDVLVFEQRADKAHAVQLEMVKPQQEEKREPEDYL